MELYLKILAIFALFEPITVTSEISVKSKSEIGNATQKQNLIYKVAEDYLEKALSKRRSSNDSLSSQNNGAVKDAGANSKNGLHRVLLTKSKATDFFLENRVAPYVFQYRAYLVPLDLGANRNISTSTENMLALPLPLPLPPRVYAIFLDPDDKPFVHFTLDGENVVYNFEVKSASGMMGKGYLISVVVEKMKCGNMSDLEGEDVTKISIQGDTEERQFRCADMDNSLGNFQDVTHFTDGDKQVKIKGLGNWTHAKADIVVSIYYEADNCSECESNDDFCCGHKGFCSNSNQKSRFQFQTHQTETVSVERSDSDIYRCIPGQDKSGNSLLCNRHPNCGFQCNLDELQANCPKEDENNGNPNPCPYTCRDESTSDRFFITLLILIFFCLFLPFCIFMFFCSRRDLRREFLTPSSTNRSLTRGDRPGCPWPFEILLCPFSINVDNDVPPEEVRRQRQQQQPQSQPQLQPRQRLRQARANTVPDPQGRRGNVRQPGRRANDIRPRTRMPIQLPLHQHQTENGMDNFSFFDDLPPAYSECCNDKAKYPNPPKSTDLPSVFQVASNSSSTRDSNSIEFITLPEYNHNQSPNQTTPSASVPLHWCTCHCSSATANAINSGGDSSETNNVQNESST